MPINNPNKLVEEFKKSGEFDRLRRELLAQFQNSEGLAAFKSRVEDVARQRLTTDHNLLYMPQEFIHRELMQELDRFPLVERSTSELPMLDDPAFSTRIYNSLEKILKDQGIEVKAKTAETEKAQDAPSTQGTSVTDSDKGISQNLSSQVGQSGEETKQAPPSGGSGSQPAGPRSDPNERTDEEITLTPISSGQGQKQGEKEERDPDSMDLDED